MHFLATSYQYSLIPLPHSADDVKPSDDFEDAEEAKVNDGGASKAAAPLVVRDIDKEFRYEVVQSLERAFAENHSLDNAAVELKTLRMASNVPLSRVKEAVIATLVDKIVIVEAGGAAQRQEINTVLTRWGQLINRIGGIDPVETITILQVRFECFLR